jgi:nicotinamidase-related amidase
MGTPPAGWDQIAQDLGPRDGDIVVTKRQWGAFYGTDLDLHLRRRGIETIVLGGIATSIGVESTARDAFEHNYGLVVVDDAMADMTAEAHAFTCKHIFPRIARVRSTRQVLAALAQ